MTAENEALIRLLNKYDVPYEPSDVSSDLPLQPWRCGRKYVELQKLITSGTLEHPSLLRFCRLTGGETSLEDLLYREFDLAEFITGHEIVALHAVFTDGRSGNVIITMDNGIIGSIEVGNQLPAGQTEVDRHEIVARRGVGSDIAVDTQIPQQSVYLMTEDDPAVFTDTDAELYGLDGRQIENVRAKFAYLKDKGSSAWHRAQDAHLQALVEAALKSNQTHKKITL